MRIGDWEAENLGKRVCECNRGKGLRRVNWQEQAGEERVREGKLRREFSRKDNVSKEFRWKPRASLDNSERCIKTTRDESGWWIGEKRKWGKLVRSWEHVFDRENWDNRISRNPKRSWGSDIEFLMFWDPKIYQKIKCFMWIMRTHNPHTILFIKLSA